MVMIGMIAVAGASAQWAFARGAAADDDVFPCTKCRWVQFDEDQITHNWWEVCDSEIEASETDVIPDSTSGPNAAANEDYESQRDRARRPDRATVEDSTQMGEFCAKCLLESEEHEHCKPPEGGDGSPAFEGPCPEWCKPRGLLLTLAESVREAANRGDVEQMSRILTDNIGDVNFLTGDQAIEIRDCNNKLVERIPVSSHIASALLSSD
jgi:hypothetical protein